MKKSLLVTRQTLAVVALLAVGPMVSVAEFLLLETEGATSRIADAPWAVGVEFRANAERARAAEMPRFPYTMAVTDEVTGETRVVEGERPEPDLLAERTVILTPRLLSAEELNARVRVAEWLDGSPATDADASDAIVVRPFGLGTALTGVEIIARPARVRDANGQVRTAGRMEIELDGPADARGRVEVDARAMQDPLVRRVLATSVLNADAVQAGRSTQTLELNDAPLPQPPGDYRLTYSGGDEMFIVYPDQLGIDDATALGALVLDHHGVSLPWREMPDGGILFYAPRRVTDSDNNDSVFARLDAGATSAPMRTREAFTSIAPPQSPGEATERGIQRSKYKRIVEIHRANLETMSPGNRFVSARIDRTTNNTRTFQIPIHDIPTNGFVNVRVIVHGDSTMQDVTPDHVGSLRVLDSEFQEFFWNGFTRVTRDLPWSDELPINAPLPSLELTYRVPLTSTQFPNLPTVDWHNVESFEVTYLGKPRVELGNGTTVRVIAGSQGRISVGGFPAATPADRIAVMDVTTPADPQLLLNLVVFPDETGGTAVHFEAPVAGRTYRVQLLDTLKELDFVGEAEVLPNLAEMDAPLRGIYVREADLGDSLQRLIDFRGHGFVTVEPQAFYNGYSGGQQSVDAIRTGLADLISSAPEKVAFPSVILVGHGSYDHRNVFGLQTYPQIPGHLELGVPIPDVFGRMAQVDIMTDIDYALLFGDDLYPDVRLARLPVRDSSDLDRFVNRLLRQEELVGSFAASNRVATFLAGLGQSGEPQNRFIEAQNSFVKPLWDSGPFAGNYVEFQFPDPEIPQDFPNFRNHRDAIEQGAGSSFVLYTGHGNTTLWEGRSAGTQAFVRSGTLLTNIPLQMPYINSKDRWPIFATFTCLVGDYMRVIRDPIAGYSIAETSLFYINPNFGTGSGVLPNEKLDDRGGAAILAPVSVDYFEPLFFLQLEFLEQLTGEGTPDIHRPLKLGEEWLATHVRYIDNVVSLFPDYERTPREFILFGDPDTLTTLVAPVTDLGVGAVAMPSKARPGDEVTIRVVAAATEIGDEARGVVAEVALPAELEFLGATAPFGSVEEDAGLVTWRAGSLLPGVELAMDVTVRVAPGAELPVEALVSLTSITQDVDLSDNGASVVIGPAPDVVDSIGIY